jgi:hypothetical protein
VNARLRWILTLGPLLLLAALAFDLFGIWPQLPQRLAVHFNAAGTPDGWLSKPGFAVGLAFLALGSLALCVFLQTKLKSGLVVLACWFALAVTCGAGYQIAHWNLAGAGGISVYPYLAAALVLLLGVLWSLLRGPGGTSGQRRQPVIAEEVHRSSSSAWFSVLFLCLPVVLALTIRTLPVLLICCVAGLIGGYVVWLSWGGFKYRFTSSGLEITGAGRSLQFIAANDIQQYAVERVNALRDFGGWGIRGTAERRAYIWGGDQVVRIRTRIGEVLLGSSEPERLIEHLRALGGGRLIHE